MGLYKKNIAFNYFFLSEKDAQEGFSKLSTNFLSNLEAISDRFYNQDKSAEFEHTSIVIQCLNNIKYYTENNLYILKPEFYEEQYLHIHDKTNLKKLDVDDFFGKDIFKIMENHRKTHSFENRGTSWKLTYPDGRKVNIDASKIDGKFIDDYHTYNKNGNVLGLLSDLSRDHFEIHLDNFVNNTKDDIILGKACQEIANELKSSFKFSLGVNLPYNSLNILGRKTSRLELLN